MTGKEPSGEGGFNFSYKFSVTLDRLADTSLVDTKIVGGYRRGTPGANLIPHETRAGTHLNPKPSTGRPRRGRSVSGFVLPRCREPWRCG